MSSDSGIILVDEYYKGHKFKRLDSSEFLLAKILQKIDNQDNKIYSIERQVKDIHDIVISKNKEMTYKS